MKTKVSYKQMLDNCEPDDLDQLHDILTMMAGAIDKINEQLPSTVVLSTEEDED